jgi:hypothetical protein
MPGQPSIQWIYHCPEMSPVPIQNPTIRCIGAGHVVGPTIAAKVANPYSFRQISNHAQHDKFIIAIRSCKPYFSRRLWQ